jgi:hypothetical protein
MDTRAERVGVRLRRADPGQPGKFLVTCWDEEIHRAIEVILTAGPGSPEDRAKVMADSFLATPETQWTVSRRINLGEN